MVYEKRSTWHSHLFSLDLNESNSSRKPFGISLKYKLFGKKWSYWTASVFLMLYGNQKQKSKAKIIWQGSQTNLCSRFIALFRFKEDIQAGWTPETSQVLGRLVSFYLTDYVISKHKKQLNMDNLLYESKFSFHLSLWVPDLKLLRVLCALDLWPLPRLVIKTEQNKCFLHV